MPSNTVVPIGARRELFAKVAETMPPRKKIILKKKKKIGSKHAFEQPFFSGNLGHYYPISSGWSQGTTKGTGLKWPSFGLKPLLMCKSSRGWSFCKSTQSMFPLVR